jgi:hypothetical protein
MRVYQAIAQKLEAATRCRDSGNNNEGVHECDLMKLAEDYLPCGSGFDGGTQIDFEESTTNLVVLRVSFHRMSEHGYYDGWLDYTAIIKPSLAHGFDVGLTASNGLAVDDEYGLEEYIGDTLHYALEQETTS